MHIASNPTPEGDGSTESCVDVSEWSDGTNGCSAYNNGIDWCEKFGRHHHNNPQRQSASDACCSCGGGYKDNARYKIGDLVKIPDRSRECVMKVVGVRETSSSTYTLENLDDCPIKDMWGRKKRFRANAIIQINVDDRDEEKIHRSIELRKCRPGMKEQEF